MVSIEAYDAVVADPLTFFYASQHPRRCLLQALPSGFGSSSALASRADAGANRIERCFQLRSTAAAYKLSLGEAVHPVNEDALAEAGARSFSKGLPHDDLGEPLADSFLKFAGALREGTIEAIECVPLGGSLRLSNPLAESAFDLEGLDSRQFTLAAPPGGHRYHAGRPDQVIPGSL